MLESRLQQINSKHGPFDFALCVGEFFAQNDAEVPLDTEEPEIDGEQDEKPAVNKLTKDMVMLQDNKISLPIPVYFITGQTKISQEMYARYQNNYGEIAPSLFYLGRKGMFVTAEGVRIGFLGGSDYKPGETHDYFTASHVESMSRLQFQSGKPYGVDILLTYPWSDGVSSAAKYASGNVSAVVESLMPRYHFAAKENMFYEREPFTIGRREDVSVDRVCRFIGLAEMGNKDKQRWFYAMNLTPLQYLSGDELKSVMTVPNITPNPLNTASGSLKRSVENGYRHFNVDEQAAKRQRPEFKKQAKDQGPCWFCLSNPGLAKHLIASVGDNIYMSLPKGELVRDHLLLIPIEHSKSSVVIAESCKNEIDRYIGAITEYYKSKSCVPVIWETNFRSQHLIIQIVPVELALESGIEEAFTETAKTEGIEFVDYDLHKPTQQQQFFRVKLPSGKHWIHPIDYRFDMQLPRKALAKLMNIEDRIDWKSCAKGEQLEALDTERFKSRFEKFEQSIYESQI